MESQDREVSRVSFFEWRLLGDKLFKASGPDPWFSK